MMITHRLEMDLQDGRAGERIHVVQGDVNSRELEVTMKSGAEDWPVPEDVVVWMRYCKSDGTRGAYDTLPDGTRAWEAEGNVVKVRLAPQMLTAPGTVLAQVVLVRDTVEAATFTIPIRVERNPAAGAGDPEPYTYLLGWVEERLRELLEEEKEAGTFDGPQGERGEAGKSAYAYAREAGYKGAEWEFALLQANSLSRSGGTMTGSLDMAGHPLVGLRDPEADGDAVNKWYVDNRFLRARADVMAFDWPDGAPYIHYISCPHARPGDWVQIRTEYVDDTEKDLAIRDAFDCISYALAEDGCLRLVCLDRKPQVDLVIEAEVRMGGAAQ